MKFRPPAAFAGAQPGYQLLPLRFRRLPWDARRASMGLPPIAAYKKTLSEIYHAKVR